MWAMTGATGPISLLSVCYLSSNAIHTWSDALIFVIPEGHYVTLKHSFLLAQ